jgi:hypothetical protein
MAKWEFGELARSFSSKVDKAVARFVAVEEQKLPSS